MALEWHFERIQWQLFRRKSLEFPCIFPCYREFGRERFARDWILRHTVWIAEKSGCLVPKIAGNRRNSLTFARKLDRRKCRSQFRRRAFAPFSLKIGRAVRFRRLHWANAMRSQTDDVAKAT